MKIPCGVIEDLLPLEHDGLASPESVELIQTHLKTCPACSRRRQQMKRDCPLSAPEAVPLRHIRQELRRRRACTAGLAAFAVCLILLTLFSRLTAPIFVPYADEPVTVTEDASGNVYAGFSRDVTHYRTRIFTAENGLSYMKLEAWSTPLDWLAHQGGETVLLFSSTQAISALYYCDNTKGGTMTSLWGTPLPGGGTSLPRLVLSYYLLLALGAAGLTGLAWLLLRGARAKRICGYLFLAPVSYLVGHLLARGCSTLSYDVLRDLLLILLLAASFFGAVCTAARLYRMTHPAGPR